MTTPINTMTSHDNSSIYFGHFYDLLTRHAHEILSNASKVLRRSALSLPVFEITSGVSFWGEYVHDSLGASRIILNSALLLHHPWYAVEDVLRHELAHYLKNALHHAIEEPPHGPVFRRMCAVIGANPRASGSYPLLDDILEQAPDSPTSSDAPPIIRKIRKLLALAESPNEHEAHLALMKARELMERHDVEELPDSDESSDPYVTAAIDRTFRTVPRDELALANLLTDFYDVRCIITHEINEHLTADANADFKTIAISGRRSKVKIALYVRDYILRTMETAWQALPDTLRHNGGARETRDFRLGVLNGIRQTLEAQRPPAAVESGLVLRRAQLDAYCHARYPQLRTRRSPDLKVNTVLMAAGKDAGRRMVLHHGVETAPPPRRLTP